MQRLQNIGSKAGVIQSGLALYKAKSDAWRCCVRSLTKFVARHNQAFHLGSKTAFVEFMKTVEPKWPVISARSIRWQVEKESERIIKMYSGLFMEVLDTTNIALTTDIWTASNQDSYLTITAHYITEDWQMRSHTLGTQSFNKKHNAKNIMKKLCRERRRFGMMPRLPEEYKHKMDPFVFSSAPELIYQHEAQYDHPALTTDNASNISKAAEMKEHFEWNRCICHCLHLVVGEALKTHYICHIL